MKTASLVNPLLNKEKAVIDSVLQTINGTPP